MDERTLAGRVALVTGASRGIGAAAALALGTAGAKVIAVGRTQGGLEALDDAIRAAGGEAASLVPMDLTAGDGIDELGLRLFERHGHLDILVHAAAMLGGLRPVAHVPPALWDKLLAANLTGAYRLIRSLEPLLRASDRGRAIFLTCEAARAPKAFWGAYAATKAGLEAMVRAWADEVDNTPIRALLLDPGPARTALRAQAFPGEEKASQTEPAAIGEWIRAIAANPADPGPPDKVVLFRS
ncbi:MAG TPA: SDR family NAD(P)-dependent oxidoreductase [Caulobacteraceae bacterium]|jgi:NAD(P)-dependent dehydrogenase (short-subunit alcohol dehydrogenase family)|nr:SDR family NAD(P)-dependent oxidoreductase [Caulobacteraceae bacterium]